jgi:DNA-binding LacI/PurR family transcriptional regulator
MWHTKLEFYGTLFIMPITLDNETLLDRRPRLKEACRQLQGMAERLGADAKLPTLAELRDQLGISMQTLSDAVRELEKRNVLSSVHGVGIYVTGQKLRKVTKNVGFLTPYGMRPEVNVAYWGTVLAGMRSAARDRGYHLLLIDNASEFEDWDKIDGAILCDTHDPRDPQSGMPQPPHGFQGVAILNQVKGFASVTTDDFDGAYQLTRHLIKLGHRRIAYLAAMNVELSIQKQRKEGYLKALNEAGIKAMPPWMREICWRAEWDELPSWYPAAGEYYMHKWLEEDWAELGCTALVVQNDDAAQGAIRTLRAAGLEVPRDVSVVGFDGLPARSGEPELTTVHEPLFDVGEHAVRSLLDYLQNPSTVPQDVCLPVNLVVGQTTATAPDAAH